MAAGTGMMAAGSAVQGAGNFLGVALNKPKAMDMPAYLENPEYKMMRNMLIGEARRRMGPGYRAIRSHDLHQMFQNIRGTMDDDLEQGRMNLDQNASRSFGPGGAGSGPMLKTFAKMQMDARRGLGRERGNLEALNTTATLQQQGAVLGLLTNLMQMESGREGAKNQWNLEGARTDYRNDVDRAAWGRAMWGAGGDMIGGGMSSIGSGQYLDQREENFASFLKKMNG